MEKTGSCPDPGLAPSECLEKRDPNIIVRNVYFPEDACLTIHQLRVCPCPDLLPPGFYWYGTRRRSPGRTPGWLDRMLNSVSDQSTVGTEQDMVNLPMSHLTKPEVADQTETRSMSVEETNYADGRDDGVDGGEQEDGVETNEDPAENREDASDVSTQAATLADQQSPGTDGPRSPTRGRYHLRDRKKHQRQAKLRKIMTTDSSGRTFSQEGVM